MADSGNPAVLEEIFGPVLTIQTFDDEQQALRLAEHPTYGLAAGCTPPTSTAPCA